MGPCIIRSCGGTARGRPSICGGIVRVQTSLSLQTCGDSMMHGAAGMGPKAAMRPKSMYILTNMSVFIVQSGAVLSSHSPVQSHGATRGSAALLMPSRQYRQSGSSVITAAV